MNQRKTDNQSINQELHGRMGDFFDRSIKPPHILWKFLLFLFAIFCNQLEKPQLIECHTNCWAFHYTSIKIATSSAVNFRGGPTLTGRRRWWSDRIVLRTLKIWAAAPTDAPDFTVATASSMMQSNLKPNIQIAEWNGKHEKRGFKNIGLKSRCAANNKHCVQLLFCTAQNMEFFQKSDYSAPQLVETTNHVTGFRFRMFQIQIETFFTSIRHLMVKTEMYRRKINWGGWVGKKNCFLTESLPSSAADEVSPLPRVNFLHICTAIHVYTYDFLWILCGNFVFLCHVAPKRKEAVERIRNNIVKYDTNQHLAEFKITVGKNMVKLDGRVLPLPNIKGITANTPVSVRGDTGKPRPQRVVGILEHALKNCKVSVIFVWEKNLHWINAFKINKTHLRVLFFLINEERTLQLKTSEADHFLYRKTSNFERLSSNRMFIASTCA